MEKMNKADEETLKGYVIHALRLFNGYQQCYFGENAINDGEAIGIMRFISKATEELTEEEARKIYEKWDKTLEL